MFLQVDELPRFLAVRPLRVTLDVVCMYRFVPKEAIRAEDLAVHFESVETKWNGDERYRDMGRHAVHLRISYRL